MAVQYHTHTFDIPVASTAEAEAGLINNKVITPAQVQIKLSKASNLSDLEDAAEARDNLGVSTYATKAAAEASTIPASVDALRINGGVTLGDGLGGLYIDTDNGSADTFDSSGGTARTWYRAADVGADRLVADIVASLALADTALQTADIEGGISTGTILDPDVTGVTAPFISQRDALRTMLNASMVKLAGDGSTDDQPEIMNVLTDISSWGGGKFRLNAFRDDTVFAVGDSIDIPDDVYVEGDGDGATEVKGLGDFPVFTNIGTLASPRNRGGLRDLLIRGAGMANTSAHGVKLEWSNRFVMERLRFFGCRDGVNYHDVWQVYMDKLSIDGAGDGQNYRGLHATGHDASNPNNAVIASNIIVQNVANVGYRLQYFNGSKFSNCELAGSGSHGWHLGAPDSNTGDVCWGHFVNCLSDTAAGDLFRIEKGSADDVKQLHISNLWLGNSTGGDGLSIFDASLLTVGGLKIANINKTGIRLTRCSRMDIIGVNIDTFDRANAGHPGIRLTDTQRVGIGSGVVTSSDRAAVGIVEEVSAGTTNFNRILNVDVDPNGITRVGARTTIVGCGGYRTFNSGTADVAIGTSETTVTHGLAETPANGDIMITPRFDINAGGVARYWVDSLTSTTFKIKVNTNVVGSTIAFSWVANVTRN